MFLFRFIISLYFCMSAISSYSLVAQPTTQTAQDGDYTYQFVPNDPLQVRIYTLRNGMKVYMSPNHNTPRIEVAVAVRAGSKDDPRDNTGLAHYLEHIVFKGTSKFGTIDWEKEKVYLQQIADLYEKHKQSNNDNDRKAIYKQIDSLSHIAAQYAVPNEYDKMTGTIGAQGTNAFTSSDQTVYHTDIPASALEKWAMVDSERFSEVVLRLFHTELETVYEEFNMGQDRDQTRTYQAMLKALFPTHPYNISTIGLGEHLKSPSHVAIKQFFDTYYVPNNMAVCLSGDFDPSAAVRIIDKYFGKLKQKELPKREVVREAPINKPIETTVLGKEAENVSIAFRLDGANSQDALYLKLLDGVFQNGTAGIMDINLIQKQAILSGFTYANMMNDYGMYVLNARPRPGQSLEEVRDLLLEQIKLLQNGQFADWLPAAAIKNFKLQALKALESNDARNGALFSAFTEYNDWADVVGELDALGKITKADLVRFANERLQNNYAVIFKKQGEDPNVLKMQKPAITELSIDRSKQSEFYKNYEKVPETRLEPVFLDFKKDIQKSTIRKDITYYYTHNEQNATFDLYYILDMGTANDRKIGMASRYLQYLGTDKYTPEQLKEEWYKLALTFNVTAGLDRIYISLSGLDESFQQGVALFEHFLTNVKPNEAALSTLKEGILQERENSRKDKRTISNALNSYGIFGSKSEFKNNLSNDEIKAVTATELINLIKGIFAYKHNVFYYGSRTIKDAQSTLAKYHKPPKTLRDYPAATVFTEQKTDKSRVLLVPYDGMVQAQVVMLAKDQLFDKNLMPAASLFGEYFGGGMSSVVFQEIREARALAYSAWAGYTSPQRADRSHFTQAFMAIQADKLKDAIGAMSGLLNDMPRAENNFGEAQLALLKNIENERIMGKDVFFTFRNAQKRGLDYDIRRDVYAQAKNMKLDDIAQFFNQHIKNRSYTYLILGDPAKLDMKYLESLGEVRQLSLNEIFGY
jgi:zinc protease